MSAVILVYWGEAFHFEPRNLEKAFTRILHTYIPHIKREWYICMYFWEWCLAFVIARQAHWSRGYRAIDSTAHETISYSILSFLLSLWYKRKKPIPILNELRNQKPQNIIIIIICSMANNIIIHITHTTYNNDMSLVWCPGHYKRIAPLPSFHGCR
jgi:hypothetical protein